MQKYKLSKQPVSQVIRALESSFNVFPIVTRDCVRALNTLVYNMQSAKIVPEAYKQIVFLILRGFTSSDVYLKNCIYTVLIEMGRQTKDGILAINCIVKDLDSRKCPETMKNTALRALFSNLPPTMLYDFEKYVKSSILNGSDNAVVVAIEYFRESKIPLRVAGTISDFHQAFFNRLPINRYSSMVEVSRIAKDGTDKLSPFFFISADVVVFIESAKMLLRLRPEQAAPYIEKAVVVLGALLKRQDAAAFAAIKILSELSCTFPLKVALVNKEIEDQVHSGCKCVSMIAILTLLKTGNSETVSKLAAKLEPLMHAMSHSYKRMAIDTMEKLAQQQSSATPGPYLAFLKKALLEKGDLSFNRYILMKFETLLKTCDYKQDIIKFLCMYLEDPEFYQVSMDVLGILGAYLHEFKDLVHVYNRLILDNCHVRKSAIQTLFDVDAEVSSSHGAVESTFESMIARFKDSETGRLCDFLSNSTDLKRGQFSLAELGDLRDEVLKYIVVEEAEEVVEEEPDLVKECRKVIISPESADVCIGVIKKIARDAISLTFSFENKMGQVNIASGLLSIEIGEQKHAVEVDQSDFDGGIAVKELAITAAEGDVVYGVFEYQIYLDDIEDADEDTISLEPFPFTIFDFVRPVQIPSFPSVKKTLEIIMDCKAADAASRIIGITNMFLDADKGRFSMCGTYNETPIGIEATMKHSNVTVVTMNVCCEDADIVDKISAVFE